MWREYRGVNAPWDSSQAGHDWLSLHKCSSFPSFQWTVPQGLLSSLYFLGIHNWDSKQTLLHQLLLLGLMLPPPSHLLPEISSQINYQHPSFCLRVGFHENSDTGSERCSRTSWGFYTLHSAFWSFPYREDLWEFCTECRWYFRLNKWWWCHIRIRRRWKWRDYYKVI